MKVLIACEESQRVCIAFRERGHEAYSCDILECSGGQRQRDQSEQTGRDDIPPDFEEVEDDVPF